MPLTAALMQNVQNKIRALVQTYGPSKVKCALWNREFSQGRWDCLTNTQGDIVYSYIEKYANNGVILDLGCGSGNTAIELAPTAYRHYIGIDVSEVAIEKARTRISADSRISRDRFSFYRSDIYTYAPNCKIDVILFRDSIYYFGNARIKSMLRRYSKYLTHSGVFVVRLWNVNGKYKSIVNIINNNFKVVETGFSDQQTTAVIVFCPPVVGVEPRK